MPASHHLRAGMSLCIRSYSAATPDAGPAAFASPPLRRVGPCLPQLPAVRPTPAQAPSSGCNDASLKGKKYYVQAQLVLGAESSASVTLPKQRRLKDTIALLLDTDT
jgi:hypothetical protein